MQNSTITKSTLDLNGEPAQRKLTAIRAKAEELRAKLEQASLALESPGSTKAINKLQREYNAAVKEANRLEKANWDIKKVLENLSGSTIRDLTKAQKQLNAEMNSGKIARGTEAWKKHQEQLKAVKAEIALVNNETKTGESGFMKFANWTNQTWQIFAVGALAITGVITALKKYMDMRNELEDQNANLKALTGLDDKEVSKLQKYAEAMASNPLEKSGIRIRSSVIEIMEAYKLVGSAKPELLQNADALNEVTKQSMILAAAAGMPLADAVKGTTIALNQYGASADQASRFVNALGAGAKFGAVEVPYIAEALTKFGSLAKQANVPLEQSIAAIEVLGAKGYQAEVTGTGLKQMFVKMMTGARDTNPAVVGMSIALENLNKKFSGPGGFNKMVDMFGEREAALAKSLISEREQFKLLTKQVSGTNTAMVQAATQSETVNAKIAQSTNKLNILAMQLVSNVSPAFLKLVNVSTQVVRFFVQLPQFIRENRTLLISITGVMALYTAQLAINYALSKKNAVIKALEIMQTKAKTAALLIECAVTQLFAGNLRTASLAMKALNAQMFLNPYVALLAGLTLLTVGVYSWVTSLTAAQKAYKKFNEEVAVETTTADQLFEALKRAKQGSQERKELIDTINSNYGQYFDNQLTEVSNLEAITRAQQNVNDALTRNIALKVRNEAKEKIIRKSVGNEQDIKSDLSEDITKVSNDNISKIAMKSINKIISDNATDIAKAKVLSINKLKELLGENINGGIVTNLILLINEIKKRNDELKEIDDQFANDIIEPSKVTLKSDSYDKKLSDQKKRYNDAKNLARLNHEEGKTTAIQYNKELEAIEKKNELMKLHYKNEEIKMLQAKAADQLKISNEAKKKLKLLAEGQNKSNDKTMYNEDILAQNEVFRNAINGYKKYINQANQLKNQKADVWVRPDTSQYANENAGKGGKKVDPHQAELETIDLIFQQKMAMLKRNYKTEERFQKDVEKLTLFTLREKQKLYFGGSQIEMEEVSKWEAEETKKLRDKKLESKVYFKELEKIQVEAFNRRKVINKNVDKEYWDYQNQINDINLKNTQTYEKLKIDNLIAAQEARTTIDTAHYNYQIRLYNDQLEKKEITQEQYDNQVLALDKATAKSRKLNALAFEKDFYKISFSNEKDMMENKKKVNDEIKKADEDLAAAINKIDSKSARDRKEIRREIEKIEKNIGVSDRQTKFKEYATELEKLNEKYTAELKMYEGNEKKKAEIQKKWNKAKARIEAKQAQTVAESVVQIATQASELVNKLQESEMLAVDNKYAAQIARARKAGEDTTALEAKVEEEKKAIKKKYADIDFAITSAKIISSTALAIMKTLEEFPNPVGFALAALMGLTGAAELAIANQQRQATQQLWTGGYTSPGGKYEPRGIVHAGEFVANQESVGHSPMRKVFNLVDHAQRTNRVARITESDIINSLSTRSGYANGGYVPTNGNSSNISSNIDMSAVVAAMNQTAAVNAALLSQINRGIAANVSVTGKGGIAEATSTYNKLKTNATR